MKRYTWMQVANAMGCKRGQIVHQDPYTWLNHLGLASKQEGRVRCNHGRAMENNQTHATPSPNVKTSLHNNTGSDGCFLAVQERPSAATEGVHADGKGFLR